MMIKINTYAEVRHISATFEVLFWDDSEIDGIADNDENPQMPCVEEDEGCELWHLEIDPNTGRIINWPVGHTAKIYYKVCDGCLIKFITDAGDITYNGDVPDFLDTYGDGYGDYLHFDIDADGLIEDWCCYGDTFDLTGMED